jgi:hypothetical protein
MPAVCRLQKSSLTLLASYSVAKLLIGPDAQQGEQKQYNSMASRITSIESMAANDAF